MANKIALELVSQVQHLLSSNDTPSNSGEVRRQACELSYRLFRELEEPDDLAIRTFQQFPCEIAVLRLAGDLDIYNQLLQAKDSVTSTTVAERSGAEPALVTRILRYLAAHGHIDEEDVDVFKANKSTKAFVLPKTVAWLECGVETEIPAWDAMPKFLRSRQYQNPTDPLDSPLQYALNSKKNYFDILDERNLTSAFQDFLNDYRFDRSELLETFPMNDHVILGFDASLADAVLFVDIGGGQGYDVLKLVERFPQAKGRKILQDLQHVVRDNELSIESIPYDFFTPQPVKGARCYHFSRVFHDWPDNHCLKILANTASAMKPGYSKLLIHDVVLPAKGATAFETESDFAMLILLAAMERSESQWRGLLERAGLKVIKIWPGTPESVIEAELGP